MSARLYLSRVLAGALTLSTKLIVECLNLDICTYYNSFSFFLLLSLCYLLPV